MAGAPATEEVKACLRHSDFLPYKASAVGEKVHGFLILIACIVKENRNKVCNKKTQAILLCHIAKACGRQLFKTDKANAPSRAM